MPSSTEKQKNFFGAVMGAKKGKKGIGGEAREAAKGMSEEQIKDFLHKKSNVLATRILSMLKNADPNNELLPKGKDLLMSKVNVDDNRKLPNPDSAPATTMTVSVDKPRFGASAEGYVSEKNAQVKAALYVTGLVKACKDRGVNPSEMMVIMDKLAQGYVGFPSPAYMQSQQQAALTSGPHTQSPLQPATVQSPKSPLQPAPVQPPQGPSMTPAQGSAYGMATSYLPRGQRPAVRAAQRGDMSSNVAGMPPATNVAPLPTNAGGIAGKVLGGVGTLPAIAGRYLGQGIGNMFRGR